MGIRRESPDQPLPSLLSVACALVARKSCRSHLRLNLLTRTVYTIEVDNVSVAANHAVQRNVVKAAYTFAHLIVHFRVFQIGFFSQLSVFDLLAFGC